MIDMTAELGGQYCRVLSGQRRPEVSREQGIDYAASSIEACLPHAQSRGVTLILENHYKDNYWQFPEFAQYTDVFCDLVASIKSPGFGVNYDPSNTILAGEDPPELLRRVKDRVVASSRSIGRLAVPTIAFTGACMALVGGYGWPTLTLVNGYLGQAVHVDGRWHYWFIEVGQFCMGGICVALLGIGQPCSSTAQCLTGFCADGVCCDRACDGQCEACDSVTSPGLCFSGCTSQSSFSPMP